MALRLPVCAGRLGVHRPIVPLSGPGQKRVTFAGPALTVGPGAGSGSAAMASSFHAGAGHGSPVHLGVAASPERLLRTATSFPLPYPVGGMTGPSYGAASA